MRRAAKLERIRALARDYRLDPGIRTKIGMLLGQVNNDPRRVDRLYARVLALVEDSMVTADERAPSVPSREVSRIVDAVTRAESVLDAVCVDEFASVVRAHPVDVDDWRGVVRSAYRLLDCIDRVDAAVSGRRLVEG